jgi:beta-aspartyl-peptidase (threonine type)
MEYLKESVGDATRSAVNEVKKLGGTGGVIAIDSAGNVATPFNTTGMLRGVAHETGEMKIDFH